MAGRGRGDGPSPLEGERGSLQLLNRKVMLPTPRRRCQDADSALINVIGQTKQIATL